MRIFERKKYKDWAKWPIIEEKFMAFKNRKVEPAQRSYI